MQTVYASVDDHGDNPVSYYAIHKHSNEFAQSQGQIETRPSELLKWGFYFCKNYNLKY